MISYLARCHYFNPKMSGSSKRNRTYNFNTDWEESYCFVNVKDKYVCLLCSCSVAVAKKHYVERHFKTNYATFNTNYPLQSELRKKKIAQLKLNLSAQQCVFTRPAVKSKKATVASLNICHMLAKKKKPFQDGELLKEAFLTGADCLFEGFFNKREILSAIQDLQLSDNTVTRRIHDISKDMQTLLKSDLEICDYFSLQFDESTDVTDTAQLAVMVRMVFSNFTVKEDLLKLLPMKARTTGDVEIDLSSFVVNLQSLQNQFEKRFQQFTTIQPMVTFFVNPFTCQVNVTKMAAHIAELV
ncbi:hypothetical protein J437_LFUL005216 [Ladona fulva]|uniref:SPIN-DOC-like zinc-finger domain-containing protein n=1 Tax=Ladona fulva TaxID=123851 RepID=A0A8K0KEQ0_LADFU|nr:hypothetical protein J437_LFUL005216 [Ladona fulva]